MRRLVHLTAVAAIGAGALVLTTAPPASAAAKTFGCNTGPTASDDAGYEYGYYSASGTSSWLVTGVDYQVFIGQGFGHGNSTDIYYSDNNVSPVKSFSTGSGKSDGTVQVLSTADYTRPRTGGSVYIKFIFDHSLGSDPTCTRYDNYPS
jgi:hypothetical protein